MRFRLCFLAAVASISFAAVVLHKHQAEAAPWEKAQRLLRQGRYEQALHAADKVARSQGTRTPAGRASVMLAARAEVAVGLLAPARARLERATAADPLNLPLRAELARVADAMGDREAVSLIAQSTTRQWQQSQMDRKNPANALAIATTVQLSGNWKWANELFREAVALASDAPEPNATWGYLFLEKHAAREAAASFAAALKADPRHPDALAGLARTHLEKGYDRAAAVATLQTALSENPRHSGALALAAEIALDGEDLKAAEDIVRQLRDTNPNDAEAAWLAAAIAKLRDEPQRYEKERDARLLVRPGDGAFFAKVSEALVRQRRYEDARTVAEECEHKAASAPSCKTSLGTTLLRLGQEEQGLRTLRAAFAADPYNARTYNQLQLFEKTIKSAYTIIETEHFRFRLRPQNAIALKRIVAPFLESVFATYVRKYEFSPPGKVMIELYDDPADFAVRTVGVPVLDVTAVCFGPVITTLSPTTGRMNWALVLAHELAHVFSLALSRERVPRWLTEGLAEWETVQLQPTWQRRDGLAFWGAVQRKLLPPMGTLSRAFFEAQNSEQAVVAYLYSAHAVDFLVQRFGFVRVRELLGAFAKGHDEARVLQDLSRVPLEELHRDFVQHLEARYANLAGQFLPQNTDQLALDEARAKSTAVNASALDLARASLTLSNAGDTKAAAAAIARAKQQTHVELQTKRTAGRTGAMIVFAAAKLMEHQGAASPAILSELEGLIDGGFDGYDVRVRAGYAALRGNLLDVSLRHFDRAVALAPDQVEGWLFLAEALDRRSESKAALAARIRAFLLDPQSGKVGAKLMEQASLLQAQDLVAQLAPAVVNADPDNAEVHAAHGRALAALGRHREASLAYGHALAFGVSNDQEIKRALANLHAILGDKRNRAESAPHPSHPRTEPPPLRGPMPPLP